MIRLLHALIIVAGMTIASAGAYAKVVLEVIYPYASLFKGVHEEIAKRFMGANPDIEIRFQAPAEDYEDATQRVLRGAVTGKMPDVAYHGLNRIRIFVERGLAVPLDPLIRAESDWSAMGYRAEMVALGKISEKSYGLPFSVSTPVLYVNDELVRKANHDPNNFPKSWPEIIEVGKGISALSSGIAGVHIEYTITGNWMFQALLFSHGGSLLTADEKKVALDSEAGLNALRVLHRAGDAGMLDLTSAQARAGFVAGRIGVLADSTAFLGTVTRQVGDRFPFRTAEFPVPHPNGKLPAGGNVAMIFSKDPAKQKAAWEYVKFATGPIGQTLMVQMTGYMPSNEIAINDPNLLGAFYKSNPNHMTSIRQLPFMTAWYAFPGENALKITDVIKDHLQTVVARTRTPEDALKAMATDVQVLLPR